MNIYYIDASKEITTYNIKKFCELFNGENCGFDAESGKSDVPLIAMPNDEGFIYTNKVDALKTQKTLVEFDLYHEEKNVR